MFEKKKNMGTLLFGSCLDTILLFCIHKVENIVNFLPSFDPHFLSIWRALK